MIAFLEACKTKNAHLIGAILVNVRSWDLLEKFAGGRALQFSSPFCQSSVRPSVRPSVCPLTFSNDFSYEAAEPVLFKFHMKPL